MLQEVKKELRNLKLAGMNKTIEDCIKLSNNKQYSHLEFLKLLLDKEKNSRKNNSLKKRTRMAKLPSICKFIEDFDFNFQPSINKNQILDLATCSFIENGENIIFMGKPGTGKTHLANAIGLKALLKGFTVHFITAHDLIKELHQSKADGTYYMRIQNYVKPDLIIIDEIGFKRFTQNGVDDFFEIVNQRYEKKSIIVTSNKSFEDWGNILFDPVLASAIVDRLVHHSQVISIKGESYREKKFKEKNKKIKKNN